MGTHPIFESDFDCLTDKMGDETTRCICGYTHHTTKMICCDACSVWQHADCMNIDKKKFRQMERNDLEYFCEKCKPREVDYERARRLQLRAIELRKTKEEDRRRKNRENNEDNSNTEAGSTDDDDSGLPGYRRPSRDERKAVELERIFQKMTRLEKKRDERRESQTG